MTEQDFPHPHQASLWNDSRRWQSRGLFDAPSLNTLYEANASWLDTLLRLHSRALLSGCTSPVPEDIAAGLATLGTEQRGALARTPYSLFDARFSDSAFWCELAKSYPVRETGLVLAYTEEMRDILVTFAQEVLFCAWHLVHSNPRAARGLLGMTAAVADTFGRLSPGRLLLVASDNPQLVGLRAAHSPGFWRALLCAAASNDAVSLSHVQVLGGMIMAAESFAMSRTTPFGT